MNRPRTKINRLFWTPHIVSRRLPLAQRLLNRLNAVKRSATATEYPTAVGYAQNCLFEMMDAGMTVVDAEWFARELDKDVRLHSLRRAKPLVSRRKA